MEEEPQSDPRLMSPNQIRAYARQGGLSIIAGLAREALGATGDRRAIAWPEPLRQRGLSCQTVAVINGLRCYQAANTGRAWNPSLDEIDQIRRSAGELEGTPEAFQADSVARLLVEQGLLRSASRSQQPIQAAEMMAGDGFAVLTSGEAFHATTVVPNLARLATASAIVPEFISIDSLSGQQAAMGADEFCATMLQQDWRNADETLVCAVG